MQKFLIIQTAFIGDVVLATALVEKLHQHYPDAQIDFLLRMGNEGLLDQHPFIHEVLVWDKKENKGRNLRMLLKRIRANRYDTVVNVQRFAATGILTAFSRATNRIGFSNNPLSWFFTRRVRHRIDPEKSIHEIERNQALISHLTDEQPARPRLHPSERDQEEVHHLKYRPYIVVAPASVWFTKRYPAEKWIDLIRSLPAGVQVYLTGGPADQELCDNILKECRGRPIMNLCGRYNFLQSVALQADATMNYVNDSAPLHFASAVNAPVTAVFCSTIPGFGFGPLSDRGYTVEIDQPLACRPCSLHGKQACPKKHFNCANGIRTAQLLETLNR